MMTLAEEMVMSRLISLERSLIKIVISVAPELKQVFPSMKQIMNIQTHRTTMT